MGKQWKKWQTLCFLGPKSLQMVIAAMKLKDAYSLDGKLWPTSTAYSKAETLLCQQSLSSQGHVFSSSHEWMWECPIKKSECWRIDTFGLWCWRRHFRVPWAARRSNQSILKEINPGCSLKGLMLKLKLPIFWLPDAKCWLIWKDPDAGKDWEQEEKWMTKDEMVRWHHQLNGY